jgi:hypothetical protein
MFIVSGKMQKTRNLTSREITLLQGTADARRTEISKKYRQTQGYKDSQERRKLKRELGITPCDGCGVCSPQRQVPIHVNRHIVETKWLCLNCEAKVKLHLTRNQTFKGNTHSKFASNHLKLPTVAKVAGRFKPGWA